MTAAVWDQQAATPGEALRAVWAEPDDGIDHCLAALAPALEHLTNDLHGRTGTADVLDLGAGIGRLAIPVAAAHPRSTVWAVDVSPLMLAHLTQRARSGWPTRNVVPVLTDGASLPAEIPSLTAAWSVVTLQHCPIPVQAGYVRAVADRLRPGGVFRFQVVTDTEPGPLSHPVVLSDVTAWCGAAGMTIEDLEGDERFPTWRWITAVRK
jgi:SAM-dependent methyltransferase